MNIHKRLPMRAMGWPTEINKGQYCDDIWNSRHRLFVRCQLPRSTRVKVNHPQWKILDWLSKCGAKENLFGNKTAGVGLFSLQL